jgi:hypothetical protein
MFSACGAMHILLLCLLAACVLQISWCAAYFTFIAECRAMSAINGAVILSNFLSDLFMRIIVDCYCLMPATMAVVLLKGAEHLVPV